MCVRVRVCVCVCVFIKMEVSTNDFKMIIVTLYSTCFIDTCFGHYCLHQVIVDR